MIRCFTRKSTRNHIALWLVKPLNIGVKIDRRQGHKVRDESWARGVLKELARRYQRGSKREKGLVLGEFVGLTGYNRC